MKKSIFLISLLVLIFNGCDKKEEADIKLMGGDKNQTQATQTPSTPHEMGKTQSNEPQMTPAQQKEAIIKMGEGGKFEEAKESFKTASTELPVFIECISGAKDANQANTCAQSVAKKAGQELKEEDKIKDWNDTVKAQILPVMKMQQEEMKKQTPCVEKSKDMYEFFMCVNPQMLQ